MDATDIVGIDLGTTNSALAYLDAAGGEHAHSDVLMVPQLVNPGEVAEQKLLPSFLYVPSDVDFPLGKACGKPHVLTAFSDRKRELPVGYDHVGAPLLLVEFDGIHFRRAQSIHDER